MLTNNHINTNIKKEKISTTFHQSSKNKPEGKHILNMEH